MPIRSLATRRERARAQAREDILLAAAEVFARRGYAAATLAELAAAAGFAAPSLYRYFESKEQIFASLVALGKRELEATFAAPVDRALPLAGRLEALMAAQQRMVESRRAVFDVLRRPDAPEISGVTSHEAGCALYEEHLARWLRRNARPDELRVALEDAARAFAALAFAFTPHDDDAAGQRLRLVVSLALEGIATPAGRRRGATPWNAAVSPSPSPPPRSSPRAPAAPRRRRSRSPVRPAVPSA